MVSILQDAKAQMHGSIDVAFRAVIGHKYKPMSDIWSQYEPELKWEEGQLKHYMILWALVRY